MNGSNNTMLYYIIVIDHYVDQDWNLNNKLLIDCHLYSTHCHLERVRS